MTTSTDFAKYVSRFFTEHLAAEKNVSRNTVASYRDAMTQFIRYMEETGVDLDDLQMKHLTPENVKGYLKWVLDKGCSPSTRNSRLAAIHSFVRFVQYEDIGNLDRWQRILSIENMRSEKKPLNYLTPEGVKLLLAQVDTTTKAGRRHLALLSLMYDTGARVQEMIDLNVESVRIDSEPFVITLFGKGRKSRTVPMLENQVKILRMYMEENGLNDSNRFGTPLFFNSRHERLTRKGVTYILQTYADMARKESPEIIPERLSCHSLRHSKAMHLLQAGVNLIYIRDMLGHVSIQTTEVYARADSKSKREALEKAYRNLNPDVDTDREWEKDRNLLDWLMRQGK